MLARNNIGVYGISIVDSTDWAVIRMVLSDPNKAREVLNPCYPYTEKPVLLVCLDDEQSLSRMFAALTSAELNVNVAYPLTIRHEDCPVVVLCVEERVVATQVLTNHRFTLVGEEDLQ